MLGFGLALPNRHAPVQFSGGQVELAAAVQALEQFLVDFVAALVVEVYQVQLPKGGFFFLG